MAKVYDTEKTRIKRIFSSNLIIASSREELSYNNPLDGDAAVNLINELKMTGLHLPS
jgi:AICAR transformylase/IMP cyclohydrolase PurH